MKMKRHEQAPVLKSPVTNEQPAGQEIVLIYGFIQVVVIGLITVHYYESWLHVLLVWSCSGVIGAGLWLSLEDSPPPALAMLVLMVWQVFALVLGWGIIRFWPVSLASLPFLIAIICGLMATLELTLKCRGSVGNAEA